MGEYSINCDHSIFCEWLGQTVLVFDDAVRASDELKQIGATATCGAGGAGYAVNDESGEALFWIIFRDGAPSLSTITHEVTHVVDYLCEFTGIPVSIKAAEVRCYMVGWLVSRLAPLYGYGGNHGD